MKRLLVSCTVGAILAGCAHVSDERPLGPDSALNPQAQVNASLPPGQLDGETAPEAQTSETMGSPPEHDRMSTTSMNESAPTHYTCPTHPEINAAGPGKCPKCGMTLVKKEHP